MKFFDKLAAGVVLGALAVAVAACGGDNAQQKMPPPLVSAVTVHKQEVPITYEYAGRIAAFKETEIRARVNGILLKRNFTEGALVKQGQILFEIDPAPYEALVAQAQANYEQSERDARRMEALLQQRVSSAAQRDAAVARRDANKAALQTAKLNLEYTRVAAPIGGATSREAVPEGSLVNASTTLLTTITQSDPIYINFSYTDTDARAIRKLMADMNARGEKIESPHIRIRFGDGREFSKLGLVDFTSPTLDRLTGTFGVRAVVANPEGVLVPGQFVRVTVEDLKLDKSIVIPEAALLQDATGAYVYVVRTVQPDPAKPEKMQVVETRPVKVARQLENRDWLLMASERVEAPPSPATAEPAAAGAKGGEAGDKGQGAAQPAAVSYIGLNDGDVVVTEGHYRIQAGLRALAPGQMLPVMITTLDGKDLQPKQPDGKAGAAK